MMSALRSPRITTEQLLDRKTLPAHKHAIRIEAASEPAADDVRQESGIPAGQDYARHR
jgi:hypothetical protein